MHDESIQTQILNFYPHKHQGERVTPPSPSKRPQMLKLLALDLEGSFFVSKLILEQDESIPTQILNFCLYKGWGVTSAGHWPVSPL